MMKQILILPFFLSSFIHLQAQELSYEDSLALAYDRGEYPNSIVFPDSLIIDNEMIYKADTILQGNIVYTNKKLNVYYILDYDISTQTFFPFTAVNKLGINDLPVEIGTIPSNLTLQEFVDSVNQYYPEIQMMTSIREEEKIVKTIVYANTIEYLMFKEITLDTILIMYKDRFDYEFNRYYETYPEEFNIEPSELYRLVKYLGYDPDTQFEEIKSRILDIQKGCPIRYRLLQNNKYILYKYFSGNYVPRSLFGLGSSINITFSKP